MANNNKSVVAIPPAVLALVTDLLNQAQIAIKPYLTPLTNEERKAIFKMSDRSLPFVEKTVDYTGSNPEFTPSFMDVGDLGVDVHNTTGVGPVFQSSQQLCDNLSDIEMVAGNEAIISCLMYYNSVRQADKNGVASARAIYEDLQKRFPGRRKKQKPVPPATK